MPSLLTRALVLLVVYSGSSTLAGAGTFEFDTSQVTQPQLAVSPDGRTVVFTMVGHLFRLPAAGGAAEQITFGPSYESSPAFALDGRRLAFVSDRDGSSGNVFLLDLSSGEITQLTREVHADSPAWSPDGKTITYLRMLAREEHPPGQAPGFGGGGMGELRTIAASGGEPRVVAPPKSIQSVFYLPDGRLAWSAVEYAGRGGFFRRVSATRIEALTAGGEVVVLRNEEGSLGEVAPASAEALYAVSGGELSLLPLGAGETRPVAAVPGGAGSFAVSADGKYAFFAADSGFAKVKLAGGEQQPVAFTVHVKMDVRAPVKPTWKPAPSSGVGRLRTVMSPRLSPDGTKLAFVAAGDLWLQPLGSGPAKRLFEDEAMELDPAFSPDGRRLAFARNDHGTRSLCVYDFETREVRTLVSVGDGAWALNPSWSPDGKRLVFQQNSGINAPFALGALGLDGEVETLGEAAGGWTPRPHLAGDGRSLYYTSREEGIGTLYRLSLGASAAPAAVTQLDRHLHDALVSPDSKWVAFRRNSEIWAAPLGNEPLGEAAVRRVSPEGGRSFAFTPDGSELIYAAGARVWRQPLGGGERTEIPVEVQLERSAPGPVLVRRVRVLDFAAGDFGEETSMLIADGRIRWIDAEANRDVPKGARVIDAGGRYAIPGLFDLHVHSAWANQEANQDAFIAYGITSVRDTGGRLDRLNELSDRGDFTAAPVPRYFFSGDIFEGAAPLWGDAFLQIYDEEDARAHVRRWKERGAHFIKVYPSLPWHLQRAVADEAHRQGLPMVGHGLSTPEIVKSVILGYSVLEHTSGGSQEDMMQLLAHAGTQCDPTLSISGSGLVTAEEPQRLDDPKFRTFVPDASIRAGRGGGLTGRYPLERRRAMWQSRLAQIRTAREHGIRLRAGTDSLMTGIYFGPSLHWELEHFAEAGLAPIDVIRMATLDAAETVGAQEHLGSLETGKLADLVLLDKSPLEQIRNTQTIWRVIKGGRVFDPATLRP